MIATALYFIAAYLVVAFLVALLFRRVRKLTCQRKQKGLWQPLVLSVNLLLLPWLPYVVVSEQTLLFGESLQPAVYAAQEECNGMCGYVHDSLVDQKVLWITPFSAQVYLVSPCQRENRQASASEADLTGIVITLKMTAYGWRLQDWDTVWSDCGNADGNIFPPDPRGG